MTHLRHMGFIGAAVGGFVLILWANASHRLPGIMSDGVQYMSAAEELAGGRPPVIPVSHWSQVEPTSPLAHYPPGFAGAIAVPLAMGFDMREAVVLVMALSAGVTLAMAFALGCTLSGLPGGLSSVVLVAFYPEWVRVATAVWSEPLYLAILLVAVAGMIGSPQRPLLHGIVAACALATRYIGVAVTGLAIGVALAGEQRGRCRRVAVAVLPSVLLLGSWLAFTRSGATSSRDFSVYGGVWAWLGALPNVLRQWAAPVGGAGIGFVALTAVLIMIGRSPVWESSKGRVFARVSGTVVTLHLIVLVGSRAFLDPRIPMDARMLLPVIVIAAVALGGALGDLATRGRVPAAMVSLAVIGWAMAGAQVMQAGVASAKQSGQFYTHVTWESSELIKWAQAAAEQGLTIYSNEPELIFMATESPARQTPIRGDDLEAWREAWRSRPGPLVMFNPARPIDLPPDLLLEGLSVRLVRSVREGGAFWR